MTPVARPRAASPAATSTTSGEGSAKTDAAPSAISDAVTATNKGGDFDRDALTTWAPIDATRPTAHRRPTAVAFLLVQKDSAASASRAAKPAVVEAFTRSAAATASVERIESGATASVATSSTPKHAERPIAPARSLRRPILSMSRNPMTLPGRVASA